MAAAKTKHCRKCGQTKPFEDFPRNRRECRVCMKKRQRAWEAANRERINAMSRDWAEKNREASIAIKRRHYLANRDKVIERSRLFYEANKEAALAKSRERYWRDPEAAKAYHRQHRLKTIELQRVYSKNRKARKRNKPNTWTIDQARHGLAHWKNACAVCRAKFANRSECHWDHWIPLIEESSPGTVAGNMVPLCPTCNLTKNRVLPEVWIIRRLGRSRGLKRIALITAYLSLAASETP